MTAGFFIDVLGMKFCGSRADEKLFANLLYPLSPQQKKQNLLFPLREAVLCSKIPLFCLAGYYLGLIGVIILSAVPEGKLISAELKCVVVLHRSLLFYPASVKVGSVSGIGIFNVQVTTYNMQAGMPS